MVSQLAPKSQSGEYQRPVSQFRNKIEASPQAQFPLERNRYTLYVGIPCPWCHRVLLTLAICKLEDYFQVEYCEANISDGSWKRKDDGQSIRKIYRYYENNYRGRCTLPLLVDRIQHSIVNNESADIVHFLMELMERNYSIPVVPIQRSILAEEESKALVQRIYEDINNGVYKAGFAQNQQTYENAVGRLFETLDEMERRLEKHSFIEGETMTISDIYLFPTIYRFKAVYGPLFKCVLKDISLDYPFLFRWLQRIYSIPGVSQTCDLEETKQSYYKSLFPLNPSQIVPTGLEYPFS